MTCSFCQEPVTFNNGLIGFNTSPDVFHTVQNERAIKSWPVAHKGCAIQNGAVAEECPVCCGVGRIGQSVLWHDIGEVCPKCNGESIILNESPRSKLRGIRG